MTNLSTALIESATMQRPGPDIFYAPPADAPQLQNTGVWVAPPILISGAAAYDQGEYLYQDYLYDDHGGAGLPDPTDPQRPKVDLTDPRAHDYYVYSPKAGTATYPTDPVYANNAADLVEFRTKPLPSETAFRFTLNTMQNPELVGFTLAIGTSATPRAWPNQAGVRSPAAYFLTVHGSTAQLVDAATGAVITPAPTVQVDQLRRQFDVRVPHAAWDPGDSTVRLAAGIGLWDTTAGHYLVPEATATATTPGGRSASGSALFNLAFRFHEPIPRISTLGGLWFLPAAVEFATMPSFWREQAQARALATGDISEFSADVDFGRLAARVHDDSDVPTTGPIDRILASHFSYGQGVDYSKACRRFPATCEGIFRGQLQPYALYVPASPPPSGGWGTTLLLHALATNYNLFLGSDYQAQLGDRGDALVISPGGRGPDGDYRDITEADVFEVWADVARHYDLNPGRATVSGFSMGGGGTFRLLARYPDLFAAGAAVAAAGSGAAGPGPDLASLRNDPVLTWIGAFDEGTSVSLQTEFCKAEASLGLRFVFDTFLTADHLTLATIDNYTPLANYLAGYRIDPNPPHVTYCVDPQTDSARAGVVADHAYWLSRLAVRDPQHTGTIDARSEAFGVADPVPSGVSTSWETLPVTHKAMPYERYQQSWGPASSTTPENTLALNLTNIGQAMIDGARAKLTGNAPLTLNISSDGPATITLALTLPPGTTVTTQDGQQTAPPVTTTTGVILSVGPGTNTYTLTPPQS